MTNREVPTTSIRIDLNTKSALDLLAAERQLITGKNVTINDVLNYLIEMAAPHIAERVRELTQQSDDPGKSNP